MKRLANLIVLLFLFAFLSPVMAQTDSLNIDNLNRERTDEFLFDADTVLELPRSSWAPKPKKAVLYAAIFPGLGQIYNRKYWKLPIVYGGLMGCVYAITWNNKNYQDYTNAFRDLKSDDPEKNNSWVDFIPYGADPKNYISNRSFEDRLKRGRSYFRRYRDLSIIITTGVYLLCIVDAYVDAELFDFDISPNLSMRCSPLVSPRTHWSSALYGLNLSFNF